MKKDRIIYFSTTFILGGMMLFSAYMYLTNPELKGAFEHMGFPDYFRIELAVAKILGAAALLLPMVPKALKVTAYVGFAITFVSACVAHLATGDMGAAIAPLLFLGILAVSYWYYDKQKTADLAVA